MDRLTETPAPGTEALYRARPVLDAMLAETSDPHRIEALSTALVTLDAVLGVVDSCPRQ